ncbi:MAG: NUDIX hydrolase [Acidimicrobiales bacterium]
MSRRAELRATVAAIIASDDLEDEHLDDALSWIDSGAAVYRTAKPATPPKHVVSYSLLVDPVEPAVLLIDHRLSRLWLPAGGHVEPDEAPDVAAARELSEELGVDPEPLAPCGRQPFFLTVTPTAGPAPSHVDVSLWYAFAGSAEMSLVVDEREARAARWWRLDEIEAAASVGFDPHMARAAAKLARLLAETSGPASH